MLAQQEFEDSLLLLGLVCSKSVTYGLCWQEQLYTACDGKSINAWPVMMPNVAMQWQRPFTLAQSY